MLCHYNVDILNICMKEFDLAIIYSEKQLKDIKILLTL